MADMSQVEPAYFETYQCKGGDMWDAIAFELYDDEAFSSILMKYNIDSMDTVVFEGGELLTYPVYEDEDLETPSEESAPWR